MTDAVVRFSQLPLSGARRLRALEIASPAEAERFRRQRSDAFLLGRLLLRELVEDITGAPADITAACFSCGEEHGQPRTESLHLSIAHADELVVVAAAMGPVGVDVEKDDVAVPTEFARGVREWTRLEAVLKAEGRGFDADPAGVSFRRGSAFLGGVRYKLTDVETVPGYISSVARAAPDRSATRRAAHRGTHR